MHNSSITIHGGQPLCGEIRLAGAKNAALPMLVAAAMGELPTILENVPVGLNDVQVMIELLRAMGADVTVEGTRVVCSRGRFSGSAVPIELARRIRYSLVLLGACAALGESVFIPQPGGCSLGDRKYDLHLMGLRKLGAIVDEQPDGIMLQSQGLQGAQVDFYLPTTSGTENIMLAATLARGVTTIRNANTRPEIQQLGKLLSAMGASIIVRNRIVNVEGVRQLKGGVTFTIMPGWDEAVTYMVAAGATRGEVAILDFDLENVAEDVRYLRVAGIDVFSGETPCLCRVRVKNTRLTCLLRHIRESIRICSLYSPPLLLVYPGQAQSPICGSQIAFTMWTSSRNSAATLSHSVIRQSCRAEVPCTGLMSWPQICAGVWRVCWPASLQTASLLLVTRTRLSVAMTTW